MASWVLVPCLVSLRGEFNALNPDRDTASDGSIGDQAHAQNKSSHNPDETGNTPYEDSDSKNEVHALDVDKSGPWPNGATFEALVNTIQDRHRRRVDDRLQSIIWNRRQCSVNTDWQWTSYSGSNDHTEHAHFESKYTTAQENDTRPWGLVEKWGDDMPSVDDLWNAEFEEPGSNPPRMVKAKDFLRYASPRGAVDGVYKQVDTTEEELNAVKDVQARQGAQLDQILAILQPPATSSPSKPSPRSASSK